MNITASDTRLISTEDVVAFSERLSEALHIADDAQTGLGRLVNAHPDMGGGFGGLPDGFEMSTEQFAAMTLLADALEEQAEDMKRMAAEIRKDAPYLWWTTGPKAGTDA